MKRCLLFMMALFSLTANAQNFIIDLDNEELQGTWVVTSVTGVFNNIGYEYAGKTPAVIKLKDGNYTYIEFTDGSQCIYKGYWLSSGNTGKYYLHLSPYNGGNTILNFRILQFQNGVLTLVTYDRMGTMYLHKDDSSNVSAARVDSSEDGKCYNLAGVELKTPNATKGIVILDGKKVLR